MCRMSCSCLLYVAHFAVKYSNRTSRKPTCTSLQLCVLAGHHVLFVFAIHMLLTVYFIKLILCGLSVCVFVCMCVCVCVSAPEATNN